MKTLNVVIIERWNERGPLAEAHLGWGLWINGKFIRRFETYAAAQAVAEAF